MIVQVREQSKINAANLRESVQQEKDRLLRELAVQIQVKPIHYIITSVEEQDWAFILCFLSFTEKVVKVSNLH